MPRQRRSPLRALSPLGGGGGGGTREIAPSPTTDVSNRGGGGDAAVAACGAPPAAVGGWEDQNAPGAAATASLVAAEVGGGHEAARAASCADYLAWRRQVHGLVALPASVCGVPSSATRGLADPSGGGAPPLAPMPRLSRVGAYDDGVAPLPPTSSSRPSLAKVVMSGELMLASEADATAASGHVGHQVEDEFMLGAVQLQHEIMDDLIGSLQRGAPRLAKSPRKSPTRRRVHHVA